MNATIDTVLFSVPCGMCARPTTTPLCASCTAEHAKLDALTAEIDRRLDALRCPDAIPNDEVIDARDGLDADPECECCGESACLCIVFEREGEVGCSVHRCRI